MTSLAVMAQTPEVGSDSLSMHRAAAQQDSLGTVLYSKGQFTEAQRCFREAAGWRKRLLGRRSTAYLRSVTYLASCSPVM